MRTATKPSESVEDALASVHLRRLELGQETQEQVLIGIMERVRTSLPKPGWRLELFSYALNTAGPEKVATGSIVLDDLTMDVSAFSGQITLYVRSSALSRPVVLRAGPYPRLNGANEILVGPVLDVAIQELQDGIARLKTMLINKARNGVEISEDDLESLEPRMIQNDPPSNEDYLPEAQQSQPVQPTGGRLGMPPESEPVRKDEQQIIGIIASVVGRIGARTIAPENAHRPRAAYTNLYEFQSTEGPMVLKFEPVKDTKGYTGLNLSIYGSDPQSRRLTTQFIGGISFDVHDFPEDAIFGLIRHLVPER